MDDIGKPQLTTDEVVHAKAVDVPEVERRKRLRRFVPVALGDVAVDADVEE
jgi:hypothetical protein